MGCGGADEEIARVLIFMAHRGRVILHDRASAPRFGTAELQALETDLPRPPSPAVIAAMHAEELLDVIAADLRQGRVVYALTAEGRRAARLRISVRRDSDPRIVDLRAERRIVEARRRIERMRHRAEAMEERFRGQRALIRRMRARRLDTELAEERLGSMLIGLIEIHQRILLTQQSCDAQQSIRFRAPHDRRPVSQLTH